MMEPVQSRVGSLSVIGMEQSVDIDGLVPVATARGAQDGEVFCLGHSDTGKLKDEPVFLSELSFQTENAFLQF